MKTTVRETVPGVRIPLPPPVKPCRINIFSNKFRLESVFFATGFTVASFRPDRPDTAHFRGTLAIFEELATLAAVLRDVLPILLTPLTDDLIVYTI